MTKKSNMVTKVLCNTLLLIAPVLVTSMQSFIFWDEVEIPESLK